MIGWLAMFLPAGAHAGNVIDRIKAGGIIRCGGAPRPGLVGVAPDGRAFGLYLDVCRAIGAALLGPEGRIEFHQYDSNKAFDAARAGSDDVFFLSGSEILAAGLAGKVTPGPAIYFATTAVMVADASPVRDLADLAGQSICFSQGANAHRNLEAWFAAHRLDFIRMGYQEDVELFDTYNAQVCRGQAGESTVLAAVRLSGAGKALHSRILPEPLAVFPILAATPTQDAQWSALVAWAIATLQRAEISTTPWAAGGLDALPIKAPELGLAPDWQKRVVAAAGTYAEIYARNLGASSPLKLPRGPNAPWQDGGLFAPPYLE
jgi:general L-amino acid transport system substrate-binding protein